MPLRIRLPSCVMYTKGKKLFVALQESGQGSFATELYIACRVRRREAVLISLAGSRTAARRGSVCASGGGGVGEQRRETEFKETAP